MVTKRSAATKLDPKVFDFNSVLARSKPPLPEEVSVWLRPDLAPRIRELDALLEEGEPEGTEHANGDPDPAVAWGQEYDELVTQFNESELVFEFRAAKLSDNTNARAAMVRDGWDLAADDAQQASLSYMLAETCVNAGWTGAEWHQWREAIGEAAFQPLLDTAIRANTSGVNAPFSRRPSPGLTNGK